VLRFNGREKYVEKEQGDWTQRTCAKFWSIKKTNRAMLKKNEKILV
jgi:hypothetical protein